MATLAGLFGMIWIGAAVSFFYYFYGALANEAPVRYLIWSVVAALVAKSLATTFRNSKDEIEYVDQLVGLGITRSEAASAWETKINGGSNLLLNLQQTQTIVDDEKGIG